nr:hypothetical protein [Tanacetum cinerariifolium]
DDDDDEEEIAKLDEQEDTENGEGDAEETENDEESADDETREEEEESFNPIPKTHEDSKDDGNGEEDQGLRVSEEQRLIEKEEADEFYRDVDINQGRGLQVSQDIEDSHVTLTPVKPDGQQESSSVSSFVTSMLNPISDAVAADLIEMELKKILMENMEGNKSIQRSDEQQNLYKALVDAYEADKTILEYYRDTAILKRRRWDDDNQQMSASESAFAEEPVQTTCQMDEPPHLVFETGAEDQPLVQTSQHPEWFSQPRNRPTPDRD